MFQISNNSLTGKNSFNKLVTQAFCGELLTAASLGHHNPTVCKTPGFSPTKNR
jgi:hypothetical protein